MKYSFLSSASQCFTVMSEFPSTLHVCVCLCVRRVETEGVPSMIGIHSKSDADLPPFCHRPRRYTRRSLGCTLPHDVQRLSPLLSTWVIVSMSGYRGALLLMSIETWARSFRCVGIGIFCKNYLFEKWSGMTSLSTEPISRFISIMEGFGESCIKGSIQYHIQKSARLIPCL